MIFDNISNYCAHEKTCTSYFRRIALLSVCSRTAPAPYNRGYRQLYMISQSIFQIMLVVYKVPCKNQVVNPADLSQECGKTCTTWSGQKCRVYVLILTCLLQIHTLKQAIFYKPYRPLKSHLLQENLKVRT